MRLYLTSRSSVVSAWSLAAALAFTSVATTGCFGKFAAVRKLYGWNDSLGNKFVKTFVYYALIIVPVYELCGAGDFLIFNLLEFWTGNNPIAQGPIHQRMLADGSIELRQGDVTYLVVPTAADRFDLVREGKTIGLGIVMPDGGLKFTALDTGATVEVTGKQAEQIRAARKASFAAPQG